MNESVVHALNNGINYKDIIIEKSNNIKKLKNMINNHKNEIKLINNEFSFKEIDYKNMLSEIKAK